MAIGLSHIAMNGMRIVPGSLECPSESIGNHNRSMATSGAADTYADIGFTFAFIKRQQIFQNVCEPPERFADLRLRSQVLDYSPIVARESLQFRNKMRIR